MTTISIHALRGEGDDGYPKEISDILKFQSTPSVGRATRSLKGIVLTSNISIHALRGEGDGCGDIQFLLVPISIHALRGEGDF